MLPIIAIPISVSGYLMKFGGSGLHECGQPIWRRAHADVVCVEEENGERGSERHGRRSDRQAPAIQDEGEQGMAHRRWNKGSEVWHTDDAIKVVRYGTPTME